MHQVTAIVFHGGCLACICASPPKRNFQTPYPTTLKAAEATMCRIKSISSLVEHFHRLPSSHPSSAAAIKSNKLSHAASLLSIKHLRESDKAAAAVKNPPRAEVRAAAAARRLQGAASGSDGDQGRGCYL